MMRVGVSLAIVLGACGGNGGAAIDAPGACDGSCSDAAVDAPDVDAASACADDSAYEPNDSTPYLTGVADAQSSRTMEGLAICPATDKDRFLISTSTTGTDLIASLQYEGARPYMAITNDQWTAIAGGMPVGQNALEATVLDLPSGIYYVRVESANQRDETPNYTLTIMTH
jgi:hypothetical protein